MTMPGRIILLNGASSSGKSTLARALQRKLDAPFLILSSDMLVAGGAIPPQRSPTHDPTNPWSWTGVMRQKFFSGFHGCIGAMARAGNDVIVDHIIECASWVDELNKSLAGIDVWVVGVTCGVDVIERREKDRGDRTIGEGRGHLEQNRIHELVEKYDLVVDTSGGVSGETVDAMVEKWKGRRGKLGLK